MTDRGCTPARCYTRREDTSDKRRCAILYVLIGQDSVTALLILFVAFGISLLIGLVFHEFCHALVANELGDDTPRLMGRLSLNPLHHLDPIGTILLFTVGFGWAKPVQVNAYRLRNGPTVGMATVAAAGPVSNFVMAALFAVPVRLGLLNTDFPITRLFQYDYDAFTLSNVVALVFIYV
ncbi:MAG: site-2 protease family protein, partial [Dehalococcoidia bacterium]